MGSVAGGVCSVEGCGRPRRSRSCEICDLHYQRRRCGIPETMPVKPPQKRDGSARFCSIDGCGKPHASRGLCSGHYARQRKGVDVDGTPIGYNAPWPNQCSVDGCGRPVYVKKHGLCVAHHARERYAGRIGGKRWQRCSVARCTGYISHRGLCPKHIERLKRLGSLDLPAKQRRPNAGFMTKGGYWMLQRPGHTYVDQSNGRNPRGCIMEHRLVMSEAIGRMLLPDENVHHINGNRRDNRLENLELWNTSQPKGQRVADKVAFALEILRLYAPEKLSKDNGALQYRA